MTVLCSKMENADADPLDFRFSQILRDDFLDSQKSVATGTTCDTFIPPHFLH
jgi:hypothetical protein